MGANATLAFVGDAATKVAGLATVVLLARVLSTAEMARFGVALAVATIATTILDAGASTVLVRDGASDRSRRGKLVLGSALGRLPLVALTIIGAVVVGRWLHAMPLALAVAAYAIVSAAGLTLYSVFRAGQDLSVEARAKLALAIGTPLAVLAAALVQPTALAATAGFTAAGVTVVVHLVRRARDVAPWTVAAPPLPSLLAGLPFALMAVATLAYYRSGTLFLGASSTHRETAAYTLASALGFGALVLPNAITTGLLPRLSSEVGATERRSAARGALRWGVLLCALAASVLCAVAAYGVTPIFGARYAGAAMPLAILALSLPLVGASTVIGTVLVAERRIRPLATQVGISLVVNVAACAVLVPRHGASGAALATLVTEGFALAYLLVIVGRDVPQAASPRTISVIAPTHGLRPTPGVAGLMRAAATAWKTRIHGLAYLGLFTICEVVLLEWFATRVRYGLRVVADTPTYIALLREMALHPLARPTPFLATSERLNIAHATPDLQLGAFVWRSLGAIGAIPHELVSLDAAYQLLAIKGILTTLVLFHAAFLWMRRLAGRNVAWIGIAVLPAIWGPALIICPGDLSFHGFMYASYHSETLAIAFMLYALLAHERHLTTSNVLLATTASAAVMVTHPFTGIRFAALAATLATTNAIRGKEWRMTPIALLAGFALASLWPMYDLSSAMWMAGLDGKVWVTAFAALPVLAQVGQRVVPRIRIPRLEDRAATVWSLAVLGLLVCGGVAARELYFFPKHDPDPLISTNRTSLYWVLHLGTWPFLLAAGAVGLVGLARLARRGTPLPGLWAAGCLAIGVAGALGVHIPLWHRFLLFAQLPLAFGTALVLWEAGGGRLRQVVRWTLVGSAAFAMCSLVLNSPTVTYYGNALQASYRLDHLLPTGADVVVAADPQTEYYLITTGDRVLTESEWHVGSPAEDAAAKRGYSLVHQLFSGTKWRRAARQMYRENVRYVVVNTTLTLSRPTLAEFSGLRPPLLRTSRDRYLLRQYLQRLSRIGVLVGDLYEFKVYRLQSAKLFGNGAPS